jgi:hypothetical protein
MKGRKMGKMKEWSPSQHEAACETGRAVLAGNEENVRVISIDRDPTIASCLFEFTYRGPQYDEKAFVVYWSDGPRDAAELHETLTEARGFYISALQERLNEDLVEEAVAVYTLPATLYVEASALEGARKVTIMPYQQDPDFFEWKGQKLTGEVEEQAKTDILFALTRSEWKPVLDLPPGLEWES